jgi:hypothetical protein
MSTSQELGFRRADAHELPFADASFDAVVGNFAVMHLSRPERAMAELDERDELSCEVSGRSLRPRQHSSSRRMRPAASA